MGRSITPKYVVDLKVATGEVYTQTWRVRSSTNAPGYGRPSKENLETYVRKHNESLKPGGVNAHIGERKRITAAGVRYNSPASPYLARWKAPMFELI